MFRDCGIDADSAAISRQPDVKWGQAAKERDLMTSQAIHEKVAVEKNILVPMKDGAQLAVDLYRAEGVGKCPVVLSAYPYHKDGMVGSGNQHQISYFAKRGYAFVMADCRGTGSSGGISTDALDALNPDDLYELVEWVASQPWCDGNVGMTGMSYGGMTALKAASVHPPHLKAIAPIMSPSAFYHDLAFPGGTFNMLGLCGAWCGLMHCMGLMPPFYQDAGGGWEKVWREHLDHYEPYLIASLEHMRYDDYWKKNDIDVEAIETPIFIIDGWQDFALADGIRQFNSAKGPRKIIVGPWTHFYLDLISVEPFDYLNEICRWFDHWLRGINTGIMDEPPVALYVQGANKWRFENEWPPARSSEKVFSLGKNGTLAGGKGSSDFRREYAINPAVGTSAGLMTVMPIGIDYAQDQRTDDALSVTFESAPLRSDMEVMGEPKCKLFMSASTGDVNLIVKLCDVSPDSGSTLVSTGWLRASHRKSHEEPTPLRPGRVYGVEIGIWPTAYCFKAGHRLRLSISCSDFPRIWPITEPGTVTLYGGKTRHSYLALPVVPKASEKQAAPTFQSPDLSYLLETPRVWLPHWRVIQDRANKSLSVESGVFTEFSIPTGGQFKLTHNYRANLRGEGLRSPDIEVDTTCDATVGERTFSIRVESQMTPTSIDVGARITSDGATFYERTFTGKYKM